jgi:hypothetical protein
VFLGVVADDGGIGPVLGSNPARGFVASEDQEEGDASGEKDGKEYGEPDEKAGFHGRFNLWIPSETG